MAIAASFPSIKPSLSLDFANVGALDPRVTFTRSTTGTYYDGVTTAKAEENLLRYSQEFDNAAWLTGSTTVSPDQATAPDGTVTADLVYVTSTGSARYIWPSAVVFTASAQVITSSFYFKASSWTWVMINGSGTNVGVWFDIAAGQKGTESAGYTGTITDAGNGWWRCTVTETRTGTVRPTVYLCDANNSLTATASGTNGIYIWGAQLEQRSAVTAYTPTTTQPITNYIPVLQTAAAGQARFDHNPTTGEALGLLIEEQRTNLLTYSEQFDDAAWTKTRSSITANAVVAPDGTLTGDKLVEDTTATNSHEVYSANASFTSGTVYTASVYVKAGERTRIRLLGGDNNRFPGSAIFDLSAGSVVQQTTGTATITIVGNGWYRCTYTTTSNQTGTTQIYIQLVSSGTTVTYTGDGYSGVYIWGAQLEAGSFPTSYIPTTSAQVTRNADAASMTGTNFSSWFNPSNGSFYTEADITGTPASNRMLEVHDGTDNNRLLLYTVNSTSSTRFTGIASGVTTEAVALSSSPTSGVPFKSAGSFTSGEYAVCYNGGTVATAAPAALPTGLSAMVLGARRTGAQALNGHLRKLAYYPIRVTNAQLQALTA